MHRRLRLAIVVGVTVFGPAAAAVRPAVAQSPPRREVTRVAGELYAVRDGQARTVFVVTSDGIILGDPLERETAAWLRAELASRFQRNVRLLLLTSHERARVAGVSVFEDTASVVAHAGFTGELARAQRDVPEQGRIVVRPDYTLGSKRLITLGGTTVGVFHMHSSRTPGATLLHFERERVVFAPTIPGFDAIPFSFGEDRPSDVFAWLDTLAPLQFDSILVGDGRIVSRATFDDLRHYLAALRRAVALGVRQGKSELAIQSMAALEPYRTHPHYAGRASQVAALHAAHALSAWWVSAGVTASHSWLASAFCASRTSCTGGGAVPAARLSISSPAARGVGLVTEVTLASQSWTSRTSPLVDDEAAIRRSRGAALLRWATGGHGWWFGLAGGVSLTLDAVGGVDHVGAALVPVGGYHPIAQRNWRVGTTLGVDVDRSLGSSVLIRLPVRLTRMSAGRPMAYTDSTLDVSAGVDLVFRAFPKVSLK